MYRRTEKNELKLALMLMDNKMYADSLRHFENMLSDGEDTAELHYFLGKVYKGLGDTDRMIESMQRAFELAPYSTAPYIEIRRRTYIAGAAAGRYGIFRQGA